MDGWMRESTCKNPQAPVWLLREHGLDNVHEEEHVLLLKLKALEDRRRLLPAALKRTPRATDGGHKDDAAHHKDDAARVALWVITPQRWNRPLGLLLTKIDCFLWHVTQGSHPVLVSYLCQGHTGTSTYTCTSLPKHTHTTHCMLGASLCAASPALCCIEAAWGEHDTRASSTDEASPEPLEMRPSMSPRPLPHIKH